jgi:hypothetical protein
MKISLRKSLAALLAMTLVSSGCETLHNSVNEPTPPMLGQTLDRINMQQEDNAEASKYVVYQHEFTLNKFEDGRNVGGYHLNEAGEDHIKQIAANVKRGAPFPVIVERSQTSAWPQTEHKYPIHYNPALDMQRRAVVVRALNELGVPDAEDRVVVAPAITPGIYGVEGERAFYRATSGRSGWGGNGAGLGGFGLGGFGGGGIGGAGFSGF